MTAWTRLLAVAVATFVCTLEPIALASRGRSKVSLHVSVGEKINVSMRNHSGQATTIDSQIEVSLTVDPPTRNAEALAYWSPFDLAARRPVRVNEVGTQIHIPAQASIAYVIPQNDLRWEKTIGAMWPANELAKIAPPGNYVLRVSDGAASTTVRVAVDRSGKISNSQ